MTITRRAVLSAGGAASVLVEAGEQASLKERIEVARRVMFARFVDPRFGTVYDYAPLSGGAAAVDLPTPDDCRERKPNALAWWCPIENGGFFGGLYLSALSDGYRRFKTGENEARRIASGLVRLAEAGAKSTPGFIARGISTDGSTHYPASSSDQTFPWFYGMYSYLTSGIVRPGKERSSLIALVEGVASALEKNEWRMPCDAGPGFGNFGDWAGAFSASRTTLTGAEPHFDAASRLLFVHIAMYRLTRKQRWLDLYRQRRDERPEGSGSRSRLEICGNGVAYAQPGTPAKYPDHPPLWTSASSQGALRALLEMEPDSHARAFYRKGLDANAARAAAYITRYRSFDNGESKLPFRHDWRFLNNLWRPQPTIQDAVKLATEQVRLWHKESPRKVHECDYVRDPLFAAWIVALSGNRRIIGEARAGIDGVLGHYQWERMHTSHFFMAECRYYSLPA